MRRALRHIVLISRKWTMRIITKIILLPRLFDSYPSTTPIWPLSYPSTTPIWPASYPSTTTSSLIFYFFIFFWPPASYSSTTTSWPMLSWLMFTSRNTWTASPGNLYICVYILIYTYIFVYTRIHIYTYLYICTHTNVFVYIHIHTYTRGQPLMR